MRKEIKTKSKRKWIVGGCLGFASLVLLTTGFATWVVENQKDSSDVGTKVKVDTAVDKSLKLVAELDDQYSTLSIAEPYDAESENKILHIEQEDGQIEPCWSVQFKKLKLEWGEDFYETLAGKTLSLDFTVTKVVSESSQSQNLNSVDVTNAGEEPDYTNTRTSNTTYSYIKLATTKIEIDVTDEEGNLKADYSDGINLYSDQTKSLTFAWGDFFAEKAPTTYYTEKYTALSAVDETADEVDFYKKAIKELKAMNKALNDATITVTAKFNYTTTPSPTPSPEVE